MSGEIKSIKNIIHNSTTGDQKVTWKEPGKEYSVGGEDGEGKPFDETVLKQGQSAEFTHDGTLTIVNLGEGVDAPLSGGSTGNDGAIQ